MPLDFLIRMASSHLPKIVSDPVEMDDLRQCAAAGYLAMRPLAVRGGALPLVVAAKVLALLPEGLAVIGHVHGVPVSALAR